MIGLAIGRSVERDRGLSEPIECRIKNRTRHAISTGLDGIIAFRHRRSFSVVHGA